MLNPVRMIHRDKFVDSIEEQLKTCNVEQDLINKKNNPFHHEMEQVHALITSMLNLIRKKVEGMRRNVSCSKEKDKEKR